MHLPSTRQLSRARGFSGFQHSQPLSRHHPDGAGHRPQKAGPRQKRRGSTRESTARDSPRSSQRVPGGGRAPPLAQRAERRAIPRGGMRAFQIGPSAPQLQGRTGRCPSCLRRGTTACPGCNAALQGARRCRFLRGRTTPRRETR